MMKYYKLYLIFLFACCSCITLSAQQKKLMILQTSDTHSQIEPIDQAGDKDFNMGGTVRRATLIDFMRKAHPRLLLFDCGDFCQGTPYYNMYKGNVEVDMMNLMKYDAATIGNHEFDFGLDNLARLFKRAKFPIVCSNYDCKGSVLEKIVKPYTVIVRDGVRIGVFGLSPKLAGLVQSKNYRTLVYEDPLTVANKIVPLLRYKEHCDVVICLSHLGIYEDKALIPQTTGIDLVLGGHTHTFMKYPASLKDKDGKTVLLLHSGKRGAKVGEIDMILKAQ